MLQLTNIINAFWDSLVALIISIILSLISGDPNMILR